MFETSVSKVWNNGEVDKLEFTTLQTFHLGALNELANVDHKMDAETRAHLQKIKLEHITRNVCVLPCVIFTCYHSIKNRKAFPKLQNIYYQPSHLWKGQKAINVLRELRKEKRNVVKQWLAKQAFGKYTHCL